MTPEERFIKIENVLQTVSENQAKNEAAIRDLIIVSRNIVDAQIRTDAEIKELRESQKETNAKLNALIETVDKIIRRDNPNGRNN